MKTADVIRANLESRNRRAGSPETNSFIDAIGDAIDEQIARLSESIAGKPKEEQEL